MEGIRLNDTAIGSIVALCAVLIINLPLWHALLFTDELQRPDVVIESSDEEFYLTRIQEAANGHPWIGHPYMYERREQRYPLGNLWEALEGGTMRVFGLNIKTMSILGDLFFPFFLTLILWLAVRPVLAEKKWRLLLIALLFLGFEMTWWRRPISPQATTILPLLYFWAFFAPARSSWKLTAVRSALIGLMMHSYPFHWTYCLVAEGLLTVHVLQQDTTPKQRALRLMAIGIPLVIIALPWLQMMLEMRGNIDYERTLERLGMLHRRFPAGIPLQILLMAAGTAAMWVRRTVSDKRIPDTLLILLIAGLVILNQMLITGKEAEFSSHYRQILFFPLWISTLWALSTFLRRWTMAANAVVCIGLLVVGTQTVMALQAQYTLFEERRLDAHRAERMQLMDALNEIPGQNVILTDDRTGRELTVYTQHYPVFVFETHMYLLDDETLWERAALQQTVVPEYKLPARALVGSSYLNRALHEKTICRIRTLIGIEKESCEQNPDSYLPPQFAELQNITLPDEDVLAILNTAHAEYVLLHSIPDVLQPLLVDQRTIGDYTLARLDWTRR